MSQAAKKTNPLPSMLKNTQCLLMDFDGPICSIFSGISASSIAQELRLYLTNTKIEIPEKIEQENDPLEVLRFASLIDSNIGFLVEEKLKEAECRAVESAQSTLHAKDVFIVCKKTHRQIGIVSNNSEAAIRKYLADQNLEAYIDIVIGRDPHDPLLMKPSPHLLLSALTQFHADPYTTTFIGDSPSDIQAAQAAKISSIGYANKPGKHHSLAHADAIITSLASVVSLLEN